MKTFILFFVALLAGVIAVNAQNLIAVQKGGAPVFYTDLPTAITKAVAGDTVYIPGGSYPAVTINKKLYLVGVGHNPDSTAATNRSIIANITLTTGADNGLVTGIETGIITISANLSGYTFSRCNISEIYGTAGLVLTNFSISENIIGYIALPGTSHSIDNNICTGAVYSGNSQPITNCIVRNNIFTNPGNYNGFTVTYALNTSYCLIENNIFENSGYNYSGSNDILNNNVNAGSNGFTAGYNNQGNNNFLAGVSLNIIFPTYDASIVSATADGVYKINFNLPAGSPYKNAGRDGTDIGIYGGAFPWKPGSIPFNPHFQSLNVAPKTDASGNLKVQITIAAQNN